MSDVYEIVLTVDLVPEIGDPELAELRWHLGAGPRPETYPMGSDNHVETFPLGDPADPDCQWETAEPEPLFAGRGAAHRVGGVLVSELVGGPSGWALTVRQEVHPDAFSQLRTLTDWLGRHARTATPFVGYVRFHEDVEVSPLVLRNREIALPDAVQAHLLDWE
ncbi:hypothetical protein [Actinophytocola sp. NPDC049390]|uniref:hypothetical protein n=1 Tax=Actinophytocola sp. NPDC049390 TaxID=3363894 RepID=UPI0037AFB9C5